MKKKDPSKDLLKQLGKEKTPEGFTHRMMDRIKSEEALANADSPTNLSWLINNYEQKAAGKLGESPTGRVVVKPGGGYSFSEIKLNVDDK